MQLFYINVIDGIFVFIDTAIAKHGVPISTMKMHIKAQKAGVSGLKVSKTSCSQQPGCRGFLSS